MAALLPMMYYFHFQEAMKYCDTLRRHALPDDEDEMMITMSADEDVHYAIDDRHYFYVKIIADDSAAIFGADAVSFQLRRKIDYWWLTLRHWGQHYWCWLPRRNITQKISFHWWHISFQEASRITPWLPRQTLMPIICMVAFAIVIISSWATATMPAMHWCSLPPADDDDYFAFRRWCRENMPMMITMTK